MNEYRFHLQKYKAGRNTKQTCPQCGRRKCFVRYVDEEGKIEFPDYVGRCDHEDSCGYHYTPKDFFKDNPELKPNNFENETWRYDKANKPVTPSKAKPVPMLPSFISAEIASACILSSKLMFRSNVPHSRSQRCIAAFSSL